MIIAELMGRKSPRHLPNSDVCIVNHFRVILKPSNRNCFNKSICSLIKGVGESGALRSPGH